jgi:hypothetical protein
VRRAVGDYYFRVHRGDACGNLHITHVPR